MIHQNPAVTSWSAFWNYFWPCQSLRNSKQAFQKNNSMDLGCICSKSFKLNLYQTNLTKYYSAPLPISFSDFQLDKIEKTGLPSCFKVASWFVSFTFLTQQRNWTISMDGFMGLLLERPEATKTWFFSYQSRQHEKNIMTYGHSTRNGTTSVHSYISNNWWRLVKVLQQNCFLINFTNQDFGNIGRGFPFLSSLGVSLRAAKRLKHDQQLKEPNN